MSPLDLTYREPRQHRAALPLSALGWPTLAVAVLIHGGFVALTWGYPLLPWWLVLPLGGWLVAWHGSLQHETIHGHPTPWPLANRLVAGLPLSLYLPYPLYRACHLAHHDSPHLTDPVADPESFYVAPADWERAGPAVRALLWANQTLAGRLLLGPLLMVGQVLAAEAAALRRGTPGRAGIWLRHGLGVMAVLAWLGFCGVPLWAYLLLFVWPGLSLTLLRSFAEHRPAATQAERTAILESTPLMGLLYFNNNLHAVHHARPGVSWHRLPALYRRERDAFLAENGGYGIRGYAALWHRYGLRPKDHPCHPDGLAGAGRSA